MGLQNVAKKAVATGFNAGGDIKVSATLVEVTGTNYDPDTGNTTENTNTYSVQGFLSGCSAYAINAGIAEAQDKKLKLQQAEVSFDLSIVDRVEINGKTYQIVRWSQDTARTIYTLQLRK